MIPVMYLILKSPHEVEAAWYGTSGWNFRKKLVIDYTKVSGAQVNFPVLVSITDNDLKTNTQSTGNDLLFTSSDGTTKLDHEIEKYTSTTGTLVAWVRIPALSATVDTEIYLYYGNATVSSQQNKTGVWDDNYLAVYHLSETSGHHLDSNNSNNSTAETSLVKQGTAAGMAGGADEFDGSASVVALPVIALGGKDGTLEAWARSDVGIGSPHFALGRFWTQQGLSYTDYPQDPGNKYVVGAIAPGSAIWGSGLTPDTNWYYLAAAYDGAGSSPYFTLYVDGTSRGTDTTHTGDIVNEDRVWQIGAHGNSDQYWDGIVDEVRLSSTKRSEGWITTTYNTINSPSSFFKSKSLAQQGPATPVLYWGFNETNGSSTYDSSALGNTGSLGASTAAPIWDTAIVPWRENPASLKFDGSNDYVGRTYSDDAELDVGTVGFTVSGWFRHNSTISGTDTLLARYSSGGYKVYMNSSGYLCFGIDSDASWTPSHTACSSVSYADSKWHYFEAVKTGISTITLYIDSRQMQQTAITDQASLSGTTPTFYVGIDSDGTSNPWDGYLDEIKVYDTALTVAQVKTDYAARGSPKGATVTMGGGNPDTSLSQGLIGYWKMDEASGTLADSSGNANTGTWNGTGSSHYTVGKFGNGSGFNGTDDYIQVAENSGLPVYRTTGYSIAFWVKAVNNSDNDRKLFAEASTVSNNPLFMMAKYDSSSHLQVYIRDDSDTVRLDTRGSSSVVYDNTWHHVVWTDLNGSAFLYVDGVKDATNFNYTAATLTPNRTSFGALLRSSASGFINSSIDDFRAYNRVLSPAEARALYEYAPGPVAHWKMDEKTGTTVNDASGNGYNSSTFTGNTAWTTGKYGNALSFDGDGDHVTIPDNDVFTIPLGGQITVEAWVKTNSTGTTRYPVNKIKSGNYEWSLQVTTNDSVGGGVTNTSYGGYLFASSAENSVYLTKGNWYHIAFTADTTANILSVYVNGTLTGKDITATGTQAGNGTAPVQIGEDADNGNDFNGTIDDVRIYNYTRTREQIVEDMNAGHPAVSNNTSTLYYTFDEGVDNTCVGGSNDVCNSGSEKTTLDGTSTAIRSNDGKFGKALDFDGSDDVVTSPINSAINLGKNLVAGFTVSTWVYADSDGEADTGQIFWKGTYTYLRVSGESGSNLNIDASLDLATADATKSLTAPITKGTWNHIVMSWTDDSDDEITLWVNGVNKGSSTNGDGAPASESNNLLIGGNTAKNFDGKIDDFKIYNYELSEDAIKIEYNHGSVLQLGSLSTDPTSPTTPSNSSAFSYCVPGSSDSCSAPIAEWNFDEGSGQSANDISGNANTGQLGSTSGVDVTDPVWAIGKTGKGLSFDGVEDYVNAGTGLSISPTSSISISSWIKTNSDGRVIIRNRTAGYSLHVGNWNAVGGTAHKASFWIYSSGSFRIVTSTTSVDDNNWHFIQGTFDGNTLKIFIDGKQEGILNYSGTISYGGNGTFIGGDYAGDGLFWNGSIDQIRIYNYARTPAQVAWDYNRGAPVAWYKMDECSGSTLHSTNDPYNSALNATIYPQSNDNSAVGTCGSGTLTEMWNDGTTGKFNGSLGFDGSDDYAEIADTPNLDLNLKNFSASFWAKVGTAGDWKFMLAKQKGDSTDGSYGFYLDNANPRKLQFRVRTDIDLLGASNSDAGFPIGSWTHVVGTWNGTDVKLYINGTLQSTIGTRAGSNIKDTAYAVRIGRSSDSAGYFSGQMDDVRIYNYALTLQQIKNIYNGGAAVRF